MGLFRVLKCSCGKQSFCSKPRKEKCPKCGAEMRVLPNWYISYTVDGRRRVEAAGPKKRQAEACLAKAKSGVVSGLPGGREGAIGWEGAVERYLGWMDNNVRDTTQKGYRNALVALHGHFRGQRLSDITFEAVERYKAQRLGSVTGSTVNRELSVLRGIFTVAKKTKGVQIPEISYLRENPSRDRILSQEERNRLMEECGKNPRLRLAINIALQTGLRKAGVYTLSWDDVDLEKRYLRKKTKGGKTVAIPITDSLFEILTEEKAKSTSRWVISSPVSLQDDHVSLNSDLGFKEACQRAGVRDMRFHDLRHVFATSFVLITRDMKACSMILDHKRVSTTERYVNVPSEHIEDRMKEFGQGGTSGKSL